jgi:hypothetical protein
VPTAKNGLVANFLPCHGFEAGTDGRFRRNLEAAPRAAVTTAGRIAVARPA